MILNEGPTTTCGDTADTAPRVVRKRKTFRVALAPGWRMLVICALLVAAVVSGDSAWAVGPDSTAYVRFEHEGEVRYGILDGDRIHELSGGLFPPSPRTGLRFRREEVRFLPPTDARKVFAVGMNFSSHLASSTTAPPPLFLKLPSSLIGNGAIVMLPADARNVHFEGELVLVIGRCVRNVPVEESSSCIFGVTLGNDLTERSWQGSDLQWMRAKASDGFGPVGPAVVTGVDYNDVLLTTRLNGRVVQRENTGNMIHKPDKVISYLSRYFTLEPGDLIFMGTPGQTRSLSPGDVVSVHAEEIGTLTNRIDWSAR